MEGQLTMKDHVLFTLDSVVLIKSLKSKESLTPEEQDEITRNIEHINIMLTNPEFKETCTKAQLKKFNDTVNL
jgi:hypothetical protein